VHVEVASVKIGGRGGTSPPPRIDRAHGSKST
jgi:hypothetical protein